MQETYPERVEALWMRPSVLHGGDRPCGHQSSDWVVSMSWLCWHGGQTRGLCIFAYPSDLVRLEALLMRTVRGACRLVDERHTNGE